MRLDYIIIQAGGKGLRLGELTKNKPKGLVPVQNTPVIFHLFQQFPQQRFVIIGDYLFDVLERYLSAFAPVRQMTVRAGGKGTCGGIRQALELLPEGAPLMLVWSDLILSETVVDAINAAARIPDQNYIGVSKDFSCRWSYEDGNFRETPSRAHGVAGLFLFRDKAQLAGVPEEGEFVRWLDGRGLTFSELSLAGAREIGTAEAYAETEHKGYRCRPFNTLSFEGARVVKTFRGAQGALLAKRERAWYREAAARGFARIPRIMGEDPLTMERVKGWNPFQRRCSEPDQRRIIDRAVEALAALHRLGGAPADAFSVQEAYCTKTLKRLDAVRDLIPFAGDRAVTVNGKVCRNIFRHRRAFQDKVRETLRCEAFALIHGDCTFSNILVREGADVDVVFLDPRGYFGFTELYGDPCYDWAKLYYSIYGDYDQFNNKNFRLDVHADRVELAIDSNGFRDRTEYFLE
jgi:GTP:adenosylcobinamide-phosphate guanylyltransferase